MNDPYGPEAARAALPDDPWSDAPASGWGRDVREPQAGPSSPGADRGAAPPLVPGRRSGRAAGAPHRPGPDAAGADGVYDDGTGGGPGAGVYLAVHASPEFQQVRSQYRRFVVPAALAFLGWYVTYVIAATVAPGLMGRQVVGPVNVALLAGLGQFGTTSLLTWAYARHARLRRDQAAIELRWNVAMETRQAPQEPRE